MAKAMIFDAIRTPRGRGKASGALQYINAVGAAKFAARAAVPAAKYGEPYASPKIVRDKATAGASFV